MKLLVLLTLVVACWAELVVENDYHVELEPEPRPEKLRRVVQVKTYTLPTRTRNPPLWYRPDWRLLTSTTTTTPAPIETLPPTTPCATTTTDVHSHDEPWLMEAIEEVAQQTVAQLSIKDGEFTSTTLDDMNVIDNNGFLFTSTESGTTFNNEIPRTSTPSPVSISSAPLWIFPSKSPYITETTTSGLLNTWTSIDPPVTTEAAPTTRRTTAARTVATSTTTSTTKSWTPNRGQSKKTTAPTFPEGEVQATTEWWLSKPNYHYASLTVNDPDDDLVYDYLDSAPPLKDERNPSDLHPPSAKPQFYFQEETKSSSQKASAFMQRSTPRRPIIIKAPPRQRSTTTTIIPSKTSTVTRPRKPPSLIPVRQSSSGTQDTSSSFASSPSGSTDSLGTISGQPTFSPEAVTLDELSTTISPDLEDPVDQINLVVVNLWNYVNGQLTLIGQQLVPAQVLAGVNITNGATIQTSNLPTSVVSQLNGILQSGTTPPTTTTTTTAGPIRPYGGVGNPSLLGVIQTIERNSSVTGYGAPSQAYGLPKPPSQAYGLPQAPSAGYSAPAAPSTSYGVPPAPSQIYGLPSSASVSQSYGSPPSAPSSSYGAPPAAPSTSYGVPSKGYGAPRPSTSVGVVPQSAVYISKQPKPTMNQFETTKKPPPHITSSANVVGNVVPNRTPIQQPNFSNLQNQPSLQHQPTLHLAHTPPDPPLVLSPIRGTTSKPTTAKTKPTARTTTMKTLVRPPNKNSNLPNKTPEVTSAPTAFVQGGNPLGALLPDFILESLAQAQTGHSPVALGALPKSDPSTGFASRLGDSLQDHEAKVQLKANETEDESQMETRAPRPLHFTAPSAAKPVAPSRVPVMTSSNNARHPSAMEIAYGGNKKASGSSSSSTTRPLVLTDQHQRGTTTTPASTESVDGPVQRNVTYTTTATTTTTTSEAPPSKPDRRFSIHNISGGMVALAAMFPATALALPILVGRKRRDAAVPEEPAILPWLEEDAFEDGFVKQFTTDHERELSEKDIETSSCRQLIDSDHNKHLIVCPGRTSRTLNMIVLDDTPH